MAEITKEEILAHVNKELNRSETDDTMAEYILSAMKDISMRDLFIWFETTVPTTVGGTYYSLPTDYKKLMSIKIDDNDPLEKITWREYQLAIADQTSANYGLPYSFAIHGGFWYPYPTPDAIYTATLFYNAFVPELESIDGSDVYAIDNIDRYYSDIYRDALYTKVKANYCRGIGWSDKANEYETLYLKIFLPPLKDLVEREQRSSGYHDLW